MLIVALYALATAFDLVGLTLAAIGFRRTWLAHAHDDKFFGPAKAWIRNKARRAENAGRKLFQRQPKPQTNEGSAASVVRYEGEAQGRVDFGLLPDLTDADAFLAAIRERLDRLHSMIQDGDEALADEHKAREAEDKKLRADLSSQIARVEASTQHVAVGGLRLQVVGWTFLFFGVSLGGFVNVIDAWP